MSTEILIIDDNADIRNILNDLISDAGYKTRIAANYNQALKEIDKKLPDIAIIDVKLDKGDNDGIELLSHIKQKNKAIFAAAGPEFFSQGRPRAHPGGSHLRDFDHDAPLDDQAGVRLRLRLISPLRVPPQVLPGRVRAPGGSRVGGLGAPPSGIRGAGLRAPRHLFRWHRLRRCGHRLHRRGAFAGLHCPCGQPPVHMLDGGLRWGHRGCSSEWTPRGGRRAPQRLPAHGLLPHGRHGDLVPHRGAPGDLLQPRRRDLGLQAAPAGGGALGGGAIPRHLLAGRLYLLLERHALP